MSKRLFVGRLPYSTTSSQLEEMFSKFGKVISCDVIADRFSGQSKGFGFVEMETDDLAQAAIDQFNGKEFDGRELTVSVAKPRG